MPPKKTFIIEIIFNSWGGDPLRLSQKWIAYRPDLFFASVASSLRKQKSQDFTGFAVRDPASGELFAKLLESLPPLPPDICYVNKMAFLRQGRALVRQTEVCYRVFLSRNNMCRLDYIQ
jgi:hypothetical protein